MTGLDGVPRVAHRPPWVPRGQASGDPPGVYPDAQAILCGNATKKKTGMKRRTAPKEPAAEARAATPSTSTSGQK